MKKIYLILFICMAFLGTKAATFTVNIGPGNTYSPASLTVTVGDAITIVASSFHPANEVSAGNWSAGITTTLAGGFGSQSSTFTFTTTTVGTIYYMCANHGPGGMKGTITVTSTGIGINEASASFMSNFNLFPSPATTNVKVSFGLNETSKVSIKLFNVTGQEVKVFVNDLNLAIGIYEYNFDLTSGIPTGTYFIEISSGDRRSTKKLLVTK